MNNWRAGDKALCVDASPSWVSGTRWLVMGRIYLVSSVYISRGGGIALNLSGQPPKETDPGWHSCRFRKIVPACDRVSVEQEQETTP